MKRISVAVSAIIVGGIVAILWRAGLNPPELVSAAIVAALVLFAVVHATFFWSDDRSPNLLQTVTNRYGARWYDDPEKLAGALVFILGGLPGIVHEMMPDPTTKRQRLWRQWTNIEILNRLRIRPISHTPTVMILNVAVEKTIDDGAVTWTIKASLPTTGTDAFAKIVDRHVRNREWRGKAPA